jgi:hypothetical protein
MLNFFYNNQSKFLKLKVTLPLMVSPKQNSSVSIMKRYFGEISFGQGHVSFRFGEISSKYSSHRKQNFTTYTDIYVYMYNVQCTCMCATCLCSKSPCSWSMSVFMEMDSSIDMDIQHGQQARTCSINEHGDVAWT